MRSGPIDLRTFREPLYSFLRRSLGEFTRQHSELVISTVAFYMFPYERMGGLCLDTQANSDSQVATWQHKGPEWYGEDEFGRFNHVPEDFSLPEFADFQFQGFPILYQEEDPLEFIDVHGTLQNGNRKEEGDEGVNRAMFPTLCTFVREFPGWTVLSRSDPFRVGVVMHDSSCSEFWRWPVAGQSDEP